LRFSWYALRQGESSYRPLPVELTIGPDLARDLHPVWPILEAHADRIDRLMEQQANIRVEVVTEQSGPALLLVVPLAGNDGALRGNAESDTAILIDRRDTSFAGIADEVTDEEVIGAIKSVPCHY